MHKIGQKRKKIARGRKEYYINDKFYNTKCLHGKREKILKQQSKLLLPEIKIRVK